MYGASGCIRAKGGIQVERGICSIGHCTGRRWYRRDRGWCKGRKWRMGQRAGGGMGSGMKTVSPVGLMEIVA